MSLLSVRGLEVRYGGIAAVKGVDLDVEEGQIVTMLGANGAGKSSLMRAIAGVVRPSAGSIIYRGEHVEGWPAHRAPGHGLVLVPEGRRVLSPLSVEDNLLLGAYTVRSRTAIETTLARVYGLFPILRERRSFAGGLLSGGEQQMLAFGRALMAQPALILMDEPSMGLAPVMVEKIMESVAEIGRSGVSILMVEQNATYALEIAQQAYVLEQGRVVLQGTAAEIASHEGVVEAFLGMGTTADIA
jgi:branched-chain amino acid transport system ATP-binding protein